MKKRILVFLLVFLIWSIQAQAELEVRFLDVGEADCTILTCDGETMIVDGGAPATSDYLYSLIRNTLKLQEVRYLVSTHPHDDHIGGIPAVLNAVPVDAVLTPVLDWESSAFHAMMQYAERQGAPVLVPSEGDQFTLGNAVVTVLHCWPDAWTTNDMCIVLRVEYGQTSFLLMGDAEYTSEYMILDSGLPVQSTVLKVGHHGSSTSTTREFLEAVQPSIAVISCGKDNVHGHPHQEVLDNLESAHAAVYRTDQLGTITARSDGESVWMTWEQAGNRAIPETGTDVSEVAYIGNKRSRKYHEPDCPSVKEMNPDNAVYFESAGDAEAMGYVPCGRCKP